MGLIRLTVNFVIALALWTFVGQIPYIGVSVENRYHVWVNSGAMQEVFETSFAPFSWTKDRVATLIEDIKGVDEITRAR